jgi:hypothetical protein
VRHLSELTELRIRPDGDLMIHTYNFGDVSFLSLTYSEDMRVVAFESAGVRFERLEQSLFAIKDTGSP